MRSCDGGRGIRIVAVSCPKEKVLNSTVALNGPLSEHRRTWSAMKGRQLIFVKFLRIERFVTGYSARLTKVLH
jgi:hypothetical protein